MGVKNFSLIMKALPTKHESAFFALMKSFKIKCRRQFYIGKYIADFLFPDRCLIVEIDGAFHKRCKETFGKDIIRDQFLKKCGFKVIRFYNQDVINKSGEVVEKVLSFRSSRKGLNRTHRRLKKLNRKLYKTLSLMN